MQSRGFKVRLSHLLLATAGLFATTDVLAFGNQGIPVQCANCVKATQDQTESLNETIINTTKLQTHMLEAMFNYLIQTTELSAGQRETSIADTQAALREEVVYGPESLPVNSCSVYASTGARIQGEASTSSIRKDLTRSTFNHNRQSRSLPDGEPRDRYSQDQVIKELDATDEDGNPVHAVDEIMDGKPIDPRAEGLLAKLKRLLNLLSNPFPVETPSEDEVKRIKAHGTPAEVAQLAGSVALQRRMEVPQYVLDALLERDVKRIKPEDMDGLLTSRMGRDLGAGDLLSPNELDEMLSTYRVTSKEWLEDVATSEDTIKLARDQSMMQAEILNSLWEIRKLMVMQLRMQAMDSAREISQAGPIGR